MMKTRIRPLALCAAILLPLFLSGCSEEEKATDTTPFDAVVYMKGLLAENYTGSADEAYYKLVDIEAEDAETTYENYMSYAAQYLLQNYDIDSPTEDQMTEATDLCKDLYSYASYEVVSAAKQDDGSFSVKVNVKPMDIITLVNDAWTTEMESFYDKYPKEDQLHFTKGDASYLAMEKEYTDAVLKLFRKETEHLGYKAEQSVTVSLTLDSDGYYTASAADLSALDALIIDYG